MVLELIIDVIYIFSIAKESYCRQLQKVFFLNWTLRTFHCSNDLAWFTSLNDVFDKRLYYLSYTILQFDFVGIVNSESVAPTTHCNNKF